MLKPFSLTLFFFLTLIPVNGSADGVIDWRYQQPVPQIRAAAPRSGTDVRTEGLQYLNALRTGAGLIAFTANADLDSAAQNHVDYLFCANQFGHYENQSDCPAHYSGVYPSDRGTAAGYSWSAYGENISGGSPTITDAIDGLMSAIYHRFGFLTFDLDEVGIGYGSDSSYAYNTIHNFDMGNRGSVTDTRQQNPAYALWPYNGYKNAQPSFDNSESPDPLPECPDFGIAGNPVSIAFNPGTSGTISLKRFELYDSDDQNITNIKVLSHNNDTHLDAREFVLFPMTSLSLDSRYRAVFSYTENGTQKSLQWHFNTRRYNYKRYEVTDGHSYDVVSGQTYIIHIKPADCTTPLNAYSYRYSGSAPAIDRLSLDILKVSVSGDTTFYFPNSNNPDITFTLHVAPTDNAIAPSIPDAVKIQPALHYLLF